MSRAGCKPLDPRIAAARGLTPGQRADLIATAKRAALPFAAAVRADSPGRVQAIASGLDRQQLAALACVLAEAAEPGRLRIICETPDNGIPDGVTRSAKGKAA